MDAGVAFARNYFRRGQNPFRQIRPFSQQLNRGIDPDRVADIGILSVGSIFSSSQNNLSLFDCGINRILLTPRSGEMLGLSTEGNMGYKS